MNQPKNWPIPGEAIFYGLAGDFVKAVAPHTEADLAALLFQFLAAFGNLVGRNKFYQIEGDEHFPILFAVIVGDTSKGRKGTSWGQVSRLFNELNPEWAERVLSGLSSGEGLIWQVRDPIVKGSKVIDEGVTDKRLLVQEGEFVSVLKVATREGNTLSAVIRAAWDTGTLRTLTKNSPATATNSHISLISHITREELVRHLTATDSVNGFANRFLWVCSKRSKTLPRGGGKPDLDVIKKRLLDAANFGQIAGQVKPTEETWVIWESIYPELSEGLPGLLGGVTSRAESQVMRLALIYAMLDLSDKIKPEHLTAALAAWDYCFDSAAYIFGNSLGYPLADKILKLLKETPNGLTRTEISDSFKHHKTAEELSTALKTLLDSGLASMSTVETGGREAGLWTAKDAKKAN